MEKSPNQPVHCSKCGEENPAGGAFCIFCGSPLIGVSSPPRQESQPQSPAPSLEEELRQVQRKLVQLTDRIAALEALWGIRVRPSPQPTPQPPAPQPAAPVAPPASAALPTPETATTEAREAEPVGAGVPPSTYVPMGEMEYGGGGISLPPIRLPSIDWEQVLGLNWLAIIGAVALAIGMGFFLKLAFDNNWIGPAGRVILGIGVGVALLGGGEFTQRRYPRWSQAVTGGGIGILYLSIYAAFGFYKLVDPVLAFALLALVVVVSGLLALRYESLVIALLGIFGAFLTPVLLGRKLEADQRYLMLLYIIVVDVGILGVSTFRNWRWFTLIGLIASYALFGLWLKQILASDLVRAEIGLTAIFLIFVGATTLFHIVWRRTPQPQDMALMTLNAVAYFGNTYGLLWAKYQAWFGFITLSLSLFYGLVGYGAIWRKGAPPQVALYTLATALVFLTVAVPLQLSGSWITVAWAAEGAVLVWVGFFVRSWPTRAFGLGVLAIAAFRLLVFDTPVNLETFRPFLNTRFPTFMFAVAAFYVAAYLYWRERGRLEEWETNLSLVLAGAANLFTVWVLSAEVISYFDSRAVAAQLAYERNSEVQALMRNNVPLSLWPQQLLDLRQTAAATSVTASNGKQLALTALWAIYAFGLLAVALGKRSPILRWAGLGLLAIPVLKLVFNDTFVVHLDPRAFILLLNFHFLTFLLVVAVVIFAAYLYWRQRDHLLEGERYIFLALLIVANLVALWGLSAETIRFFDSRKVVTLQSQAASNGKLLSLTALWAIYALGLLGVALWKRSGFLRWAGLGLLAVAVLKYVLIDTFAVALNPRTYALLLNFHFATFLLVLAVVVFAAYLYWRQREELWESERNLLLGLVVAANVLALWSLSAEALRFFDSREVVLRTNLASAKQLSLTLLWAVYASGIIAAGMVRRSRTARLAGLALLAIPVAKLFVLDVFLLERGYRVAAFITLGVLLLATGLAYQRYSQAIRGFLFGKQA
ncbi:MAG: DUF2339 domain-containing protein [Chloroflexi bacterium]|nr:DUF2339 domain-containing protein [Chloroflexota bacterium]